MPEGDAVWRTARRLHETFVDEAFAHTEFRWGRRPSPDLAGRVTLEVLSRGKHILHRVSGGITIHTHLRMDGTWRIRRAPEVSPRARHDHRVRVLLESVKHCALGIDLGMVDVIKTHAEDQLVGHLGPDLLGPDWDEDAALDNLQRDQRPIGAALLDQRNLAGIGTIYASEPLFLKRIHPWQPAAGLDRAELAKIVDVARKLLLRNCSNDVPTTTGSQRRGEAHFVHGRSGRPCRRCGGTVRVARIGAAPQERTMFYCPACQGGLAPTDDGLPQAPLGYRRT